jgi:hypothetical protein
LAGPDQLADAVAGAVARSDVGALAVAREPASFLLALADSVTWAMYWQEPDDWDRRLAHPRVAEQLSPVADAVSKAPAARWWSTPMDPAVQEEVVFDDRDGRPDAEAPADMRAALLAWRTETLEGERRAAELPDDPRAPYSVGCELQPGAWNRQDRSDCTWSKTSWAGARPAAGLSNPARMRRSSRSPVPTIGPNWCSATRSPSRSPGDMTGGAPQAAM